MLGCVIDRRDRRFAVAVIAALLCGLARPGTALPAAPNSSRPLFDLLASVPNDPAGLTDAQTANLQRAAENLERWAAEQPLSGQLPSVILDTVRRLIDANQQVDQALERVLAIRTRFAAMPASGQRQHRLNLYLQTVSTLVDVSGRLRHQLRDMIDVAAYLLDPRPHEFRQLLDLLLQKQVSIGGAAMAYMLFDPPPGSGAKPYTTQEKYTTLNLISATKQADLMPVVADFLRQTKNPSLTVIAVELIRRVGLPQKPRADADPQIPKPPILAEELSDILQRVREDQLPAHLVAYRRDLLAWLALRIERGVTEDSYRLGQVEVRAGDWLLMRNPSPYNRFTDLAPGLFTHVGVVTVEQGEDGIRRFVVVDLPERGAEIPATTVDSYLGRTLHFVFLRHDDPEVCRAMGQAAADMIGNESQFDLKFDTSRVLALKGEPLQDARIHTYCAGFLLVCAQATSAPREEFFPIAEAAPGGNLAANLGRLGLAIGPDFVSPTGALFSPRLKIVGRREPLYDPGREVQEAIYDHFAECMVHKTLTPSPDVLQALRERLASLAKEIPWLARAMARAHNVSEQMDLEAAAKAAAVIETLDQIAEENLNGFAEAQAAVLAGTLTAEKAKQYTSEQITRVKAYQARHADLFRRWEASQVTPRQVRIELVRYYADRGRRQLDERFFSGGN